MTDTLDDLARDDRLNARHAAMVYLTRREHSVQELLTKIGRKGLDPQAVEQAVCELTDEGLQSDQRYADSVVSARISQGKGPLHILHGLKQCGVASAVAEAALAEAQVDWRALATKVRAKRFGLDPVKEAKAHAKQMRFLLGRGFDAQDAHAALNASEQMDTDTDFER